MGFMRVWLTALNIFSTCTVHTVSVYSPFKHGSTAIYALAHLGKQIENVLLFPPSAQIPAHRRAKHGAEGRQWPPRGRDFRRAPSIADAAQPAFSLSLSSPSIPGTGHCSILTSNTPPSVATKMPLTACPHPTRSIILRVTAWTYSGPLAQSRHGPRPH